MSGGPVVPDIRAVWQPNTRFGPGDVFTYLGGVYEVTASYTSGGSFGASDLANTTVWEAQSGTFAAVNALAGRVSQAARSGARLTYYDGFKRGTGQLTLGLNDGLFAPTGQRYSQTGANTVTSKATINASYRVQWSPTDFGASSPMQLVVNHDTVQTAMGVQFVFLAGTTSNENIVLGATPVAFADRSVQFTVSPTGAQLFYTIVNTDPASPGYPGAGTSIVNIGSAITFATPCKEDGATVYEIQTRLDVARSELTIDHPGGTTTIADPNIVKYWGALQVMQQRRNFATDGTVEYVSAWASEPAQRRSGVAAEVVFPGVVGNEARTQKPASFVPGALRVTAGFTPNAWAQQEAIAGLWGDEHSFALAKSSTGRLLFYISLDGVTDQPPAQSSIAAPTSATDGRNTYDPATGNVTFATSSDFGATWSTLGTTQTIAGGGAPFNPSFAPIMVAGRGTSSSFPYAGRVRYATIEVGTDGSGGVVCSPDFTQMWPGSPQLYRDAQNNLWRLRGPSVLWKVNPSAIVGDRLADLTPGVPGRLAGGTAAGAPSTGTWRQGDFVPSGDGNMYVCTVSGTPGTWVQIGPGAAIPGQVAAYRTTDSAARTDATTGYAADDQLVVSVAANKVYRLLGLLIVDAADTADFKMAFDWTASGTAGTYQARGIPTSTAAGATTAQTQFLAKALATTTLVGGTGAGTKVGIHYTGLVRTSNTAGTFTLLWSCNTSDATGAKLLADSHMVLTQIA